MITVIVNNQFKKESMDKVVPLYKNLVAVSRQDKGCIRYDGVQSAEDPSQLTMIEVWESQEALKAHGANPEFKKLAAELKPYTEVAGEISVYKELV